MRLRRTLLGISQEQLAEALGLTFQQVQKYERGTNRISASRLYQLSRVLDVKISWFYEDMAPELLAGRNVTAAPLEADEEREGGDSDPMSRRETLELIRVYCRINDRKMRKKLFEMTKALAGGGERL